MSDGEFGARDRVLAATSLSLGTFVAFKLISLFVAPLNLVLSLFLVAHPLGVLIGARWFDAPEARRRALQGYFLVTCLTLLALSLLRYVAPTLEPPWLSRGFPLAALGGVVAAAGLVLAPFALWSGVIEYLLLSQGRARPSGYGGAYGVVLGGAVLGLALGYALLPWLGALGLYLLVVAMASQVAFPRLGTRVALGFVLLALTSAALGLDPRFVAALSPAWPHTARALLDQGARLGRAEWNAHAYTQMIEDESTSYGAYDNLVYWTVPLAEGKPLSEDDVVFAALPKNARLAIVGVGGGRQVQSALRARPDLEIDAFEINQTVVSYFLRERPEANRRAFLGPRVHALAVEGRAGVLASPRAYDGIYLPEVGTVLGYYRAQALDLNFIHTEQAYRDYLARLAPGGVLATAFASYADPDLQMSRRTLTTLVRLGLVARGFESADYRIVVATRPADAQALDASVAVAAARGLRELGPSSGEPLPSDDLGASWVTVYTPRRTLSHWGLVSGALSVGLVVAVVLALGGRQRRRAAGAPGQTLRLAIAAGLGAAFVVLENAAILQLARALFSLADAVILGSMAFLSAAAVGARFAERIAARGLLAVGGAAAAFATAVLLSPQPLVVFSSALLLACISGALLPLLLDSARDGALPSIYACDSAGAIVGVVLAWFVPLLFGMRVFCLVAVAGYALLGMGTLAASRTSSRRTAAS